MAIRTHHFDSSYACAASLAAEVAGQLQRAIQRKGKAILAVSGGQTPRLMFAALSQKELDWSKVTVTLVDERWVGEMEERSNARMVRDFLLQNKAKQAVLVPLYAAKHSAQSFSEQMPEEVVQVLKDGFDVIILGMGLDGHTASFFPQGDKLKLALSQTTKPGLVAIEAPDALEPRITFSVSALASCQHIYLQVEGDKKIQVFKEIIQSLPDSTAPLGVFLRQASAIDVFEAGGSS